METIKNKNTAPKSGANGVEKEKYKNQIAMLNMRIKFNEIDNVEFKKLIDEIEKLL